MNSGTRKLGCRTSTTWRSVWPSNVSGSSFEEFSEIRRIEFLGRRELPEQGAEMLAELGHAGIQKAFDGIAGLGEHAAVHRKTRTFQREHEAVRHLARPLAKRRRRLRAIESAVDLDRGQPLARIGQLFRMRETLRIKDPAPRREGPAADADADLAGFHGHSTVTFRWHMIAQAAAKSKMFRRQKRPQWHGDAG